MCSVNSHNSHISLIIDKKDTFNSTLEGKNRCEEPITFFDSRGLSINVCFPGRLHVRQEVCLIESSEIGGLLECSTLIP